jgi:E3 ubiquitin-protein ligase TRIP12
MSSATDKKDYRSYQTYKPCANKLLSKKWDEHSYQQHRRAMSTAKAMVDHKAPKRYMHIAVKLKKIQTEEEKLAEVERDNRKLLAKMSHIYKTQGGTDCRNDYEHKSLNMSKRQNELIAIAHANAGVLARIQAKKPTYSRGDWESDFEKSETFKASITQFPAIKGATPNKTQKEETIAEEAEKTA